jgi:hypothetical protein
VPRLAVRNLEDLGLQLLVGVRASRWLAAPPCPVPARGDTEHPAQGRDRIRGLLQLDKLVPFHGIELVSRAKKAAAFTKISRSSRRIRFSRRSRRNSSRSSVVRPSWRLPSSSSACLSRLAQGLSRHVQVLGNLSVGLPTGAGQPNRLYSKLRWIASGLFRRCHDGHLLWRDFPPSVQASTKTGQLDTCSGPCSEPDALLFSRLYPSRSVAAR